MSDYITIEGMQRLQARLSDLIGSRPAVIDQIVKAREMGDLSENAEYHAARERQRHIDGEINRINTRIGKLKVLDPTKIAKDAVRFGAMVTVQETGVEKTQVFHLVGVDEVYERDDEIVQLSFASPIGRSMVGKKKGDVCRVITPVGSREFTILNIE